MQLRSTVYIAAAVLLAGAGPAQAKQPTNGKSVNSAAPATGETKVCRKLVTSGTRFTEKVCLTKAEWEKVEAQG